MRGAVKTKLSQAQIYILCWAEEKDRAFPGACICTTNSVPSMIKLRDGRVIDQPPGVAMAAVVGLVRRGLMQRKGMGGSFIELTDAGRSALRERADLVEEMVRAHVERQRLLNEEAAEANVHHDDDDEQDINAHAVAREVRESIEPSGVRIRGQR